MKTVHFLRNNCIDGGSSLQHCVNTVSQQKVPCKWDLSHNYNSTQLSTERETWLEDSLLRLQNKGNLTHSQSTLNTSHMIIETHSPWVWLSVSVNIEWLGWGLVWAQWAIWRFEEALSLKPHRAVIWLFYVITDTVLPLPAIHSHCVDVH